MRFELHCHSTCSDGTEPPDRVAARAAQRGVEVFALTDHDTCVGAAIAGATASTAVVPGSATGGMRAIRAVEMSCDDKGRTVHVLAFDRGGDWARLDERLAAVRVARKHRLRTMAARLAQRGIRVELDLLLAEADRRSVGRPDLARAMVASGAASSMKDAFSRHLFDRGPVDVPHTALPIEDAIAVGREAGAAMSLAHPHVYDERSAPMLRRLKEAGLTGIEAFYGGYDAHQRARWVTLADELGLVCTGGSDWHGPEEAMAQPGVDLPEARSEALLRWLEPVP